ncbi:MAG: GIY-YIG nuclease family protein, partial [Smithella sp.]|nr:GIY-YIG nuclease family protein [Smithella sp.]
QSNEPVGIESYWHDRFSNKRKNGEWFELSKDDVRAFKRRKYM